MNEIERKMTANKVICKAFAVNTVGFRRGRGFGFYLSDVICENKVLCLL